MPDLVNQILEIRFKPNPRILDFRGSWANAISIHMNLSNWKIIENRIDMADDQNLERAFLSFRNLGFVSKDSPTPDFLIDRSAKYLRYLWDLKVFEGTLLIERIGVRSQFCTKYNGNFDELLKKYLERYLNLTQTALKILNAKIVDIGGNVNFEDEIGKFNTMSGPMLDSQIEEFIKTTKEVPPVGLYLDIDYWNIPNKELSIDEIIKYVKKLSNGCYKKNDLLNNIITN